MNDDGGARGLPGDLRLVARGKSAAILVSMALDTDLIAIGQRHGHLHEMAHLLKPADGDRDDAGAIYCLNLAARHLRGRLALEIGHDQTSALTELLGTHNFQDIRAVSDYQGRNRFLFANYG